MGIASKHEIITEDEETDINVDNDDDDPFDKSFDTKSESIRMNKLNFSISNILSDNFGSKPIKIEPNQTDKNIFRPFDIKDFVPSNSSCKTLAQNPSSIFLSNFRSEVFDYSTKHASPQIKSDNSLRNSLYNSLSSYPNIQEEILNSHQKNQKHQSASSISAHSLKLPPLGGLCKTVSQIGQENQFALSSSSSLTTQLKFSTSVDSIKVQPSSTDSLDSDDCASEASASKDENQKMWPAWVSHHKCLKRVLLKLNYYAFFSLQIFCTRYSDRPSSGEFR
jgi:hypothetical protein